jgi:nucleolar GTP-binding protein
MSFVKIGKVDDAQEMIDIAFRKGRTSRDEAHDGLRGKNRLVKSRSFEYHRVHEAGISLRRQLTRITRAFPRFEEMDPFYQELVKTLIDPAELANALNDVEKAIFLVDRETTDAEKKIAKCTDYTAMNAPRKHHYGRCAAVMRRLGKQLKYLDGVRREFRELPTVKTSLPTVVIAGMPNVGKSTLLYAITGAKPDIQPYPFTTKQLMLGYAEIGERKVQFIDTPGVLERPASKRNSIEARAALALRHLADIVLFVIDPTATCGYETELQLKLLEELKKEFDAPFLVVANKADKASAKEIGAIPAHLDAVHVAAAKGSGIEQLVKKLETVLPEETEAEEESPGIIDDDVDAEFDDEE